MDVKAYLKHSGRTTTELAAAIGRAQSVISRLANRVHKPDPDTAVSLVVESKGAVTLNEIYEVPKKYWGKQ